MRPPFINRWRGLLVLLVLGLGIWSILTLHFRTELLPLFPQNLPSVRILAHAQASVTSEREVLAVPATGSSLDWSAMAKLADKLTGKAGLGEIHLGMGTGGPPSQLIAALIAAQPADRFSAVTQAVTPTALPERLARTLDEMSGAVDEAAMGQLHFDPLRLQEIAFAGRSGEPNPLSKTPPVLAIDAPAPLKTFQDDQAFVAHIRASLADAGITPGQLLLTGQPAIVSDVSLSMKRDIFVMLAFTIGLASLAFWLTYRSLMPLVWIICTQLLALLCALTAARLIFHEINVLSIGFSSILLGVGMDYCILVYHFFAQPGEVDRPQWQELRRAIWLSSITTAATFGVLFFSSFPGLQQLAVLVGIGLLATALFATTLLADLLQTRRPTAPRWLGTASDRGARGISRQRLLFALGAALLIVIALVLMPHWLSYRFYDGSIEQLEPTRLESSRAARLLQDALPPTPPAGTLAANRANWTPVDLQLVAHQFAAAGLDSTWSGSTLQILDALNRWHSGTMELDGPSEADGAWIQLRHDLNHAAVGDFERLSLAMLFIVLILCAFTHRSLRLVGLNLGALAFALFLLGAMLYVTGNSMTIVSLLCIPLMIGLVIDYSLHILLALEHAGGDIVMAFRHIAIPVLLTGLASIIGFTAPMLSSQPALQNFGNVMDLGILAAVISGLIVLPAFYALGKNMTQRPCLLVGPHHSKSLYRATPFAVAARLAAILPLGLTRGIGAGMGHLYAATHPGKVDVVQQNLRLLQPDLARSVARQVYPAFGRTMADYFYIGTRARGEAVKIIGERAGDENLLAAQQLGKGGIVVTAHFGLFELGGLLMAEQGLPVAVLTFPEPSSELSQWRKNFRRHWGVETIEIGTDPFAFVPIAEHLQKGGFIAVLIDRPHLREKIPVRFPGGLSHFSSGLLLLAAHCGSPVLPATMVRLPNGFYRAEVSSPIFIQNRGSRGETLGFYSQQIADILTPSLCAHPEQWYQFAPLFYSPPFSA